MTARIAIAVATVFLSLPAVAQTPSGSIQGQVVDQNTGAPVRFANVALRGPFAKRILTPLGGPPGSVPIVEAVADEQGRFVFADVAPGNYALRALRDGYAPTTYGGTRAATTLVPVKDGEQVTGIALPMPPCGVIAGKVVNEKGEPVQNVELVVLRYYYGAWLWRLAATPETPLKTYSNDLGEFRIPNLVAGSYIVRAAALPQMRGNTSAGSDYPSVFFPNALSPEAADPVTVTSGEVTQANFALQPGPAFHISGVIDSGGTDRPVCIGLSPKRYNSAVAQVIGRVGRRNNDGQFTINAVPPGSYVLSASVCRGTPPLGAFQSLEVAGNLEGVRIHLGSGQRLSGVVKGEGVDSSRVKLVLRTPDLLAGFVPRAAVRTDGGFVFENVLPGRHLVDFAGLPAGAYVKSVKYGGREVPESGFEIDGDASLEIVLSSQGAAQLSGIIRDKTGGPAPYPMITVIPADGGPAESAKDVMGDKDGNFVFPALRPGAYKALAWEVRYNPFGLEAADPVLPQLFDANARLVSLAPGTPKSIGLTLNTVEDVNRARAGARMTPPKNP